jgi:chromate transporter
MVPVMQKEIVEKKGWLASDEFMDILAVSQATPGLFAMNMASHIGYKLKGTLGGIVGALAVALPSIIAILLIAMFFQAFKDNIYVGKIFMGIRPAVVALIAAPLVRMAHSAKISWATAIIPIAGALLIWLGGLSPIWIILVTAVTTLLYTYLVEKRNKKFR